MRSVADYPIRLETRGSTRAWRLAGQLIFVLSPIIGTLFFLEYVFRNGISLIGLGIFLFKYATEVIGGTVGAHRYFSHRSFRASPGLKIFLIIFGSMGNGSVFTWAAYHRRHHQFSDEPEDVHSPFKYDRGTILTRLKNVYHSHIGWIFAPERPVYERYIPDWLKDKTAVRFDALSNLWTLIGFFYPALLGFLFTGGTAEGALMGFLYGMFSLFCVHNIILCINSLCHLVGRKKYETSDQSRNNLFVSIFCFGEGWHNNHHAFPSVARFGFDPNQYDIGFYFIKLMERLGFASHVKESPSESFRLKKLIS